MAEKAEKPALTVREAGRRGGIKVRDEGLVDYAVMGAKGGEVTRQRYGPEHYKAIGQQGGLATSSKYGPGFYKEIGLKGGQRVKDLIEAGKASEGEG